MPQEAIQEKIDSGLIQVFTKQDGAKRSGIPRGWDAAAAINNFWWFCRAVVPWISLYLEAHLQIQPELRKLKLSLPTMDAIYIEYWYE